MKEFPFPFYFIPEVMSEWLGGQALRKSVLSLNVFREHLGNVSVTLCKDSVKGTPELQATETRDPTSEPLYSNLCFSFLFYLLLVFGLNLHLQSAVRALT